MDTAALFWDGTGRPVYLPLVCSAGRAGPLDSSVTLGAVPPLLHLSSTSPPSDPRALFPPLPLGADTLDGYVLRHIGILVAFTTMLPAVVASAPAQIDPTEYFLTSLHLLVHVAMA